MACVEDHAEALLCLGALDRATAEVNEILGAAPLRERAHALLMRARYGVGDAAGPWPPMTPPGVLWLRLWASNPATSCTSRSYAEPPGAAIAEPSAAGRAGSGPLVTVDSETGGRTKALLRTGFPVASAEVVDLLECPLLGNAPASRVRYEPVRRRRLGHQGPGMTLVGGCPAGSVQILYDAARPLHAGDRDLGVSPALSELIGESGRCETIRPPARPAHPRVGVKAGQDWRPRCAFAGCGDRPSLPRSRGTRRPPRYGCAHRACRGCGGRGSSPWGVR